MDRRIAVIAQTLRDANYLDENADVLAEAVVAALDALMPVRATAWEVFACEPHEATSTTAGTR